MLAVSASVVNGSGIGLLLEDGEEGQHQEGQAYVDGGRSKKRLRMHPSIRCLSTKAGNSEIGREIVEREVSGHLPPWLRTFGFKRRERGSVACQGRPLRQWASENRAVAFVLRGGNL